MAGEEASEQLRFKLIEEVQKNPVIFDKSHPNHYKTNVTNDVWSEIGLVIGVEGNLIGSRLKFSTISLYFYHNIATIFILNYEYIRSCS